MDIPDSAYQLRAHLPHLSASKKRALRLELQGYMHHNPSLSWLPPVTGCAPSLATKCMVGLATVMILMSGMIPAVHAQFSRPGQWLYPIKQLVEESQLYFASDPQTKARLRYSFALRRLQEWEESRLLEEASSTQDLALMEAMSSLTNVVDSEWELLPPTTADQLKNRLESYQSLDEDASIDDLLDKIEAIQIPSATSTVPSPLIQEPLVPGLSVPTFGDEWQVQPVLPLLPITPEDSTVVPSPTLVPTLPQTTNTPQPVLAPAVTPTPQPETVVVPDTASPAQTPEPSLSIELVLTPSIPNLPPTHALVPAVPDIAPTP